MLLSEFFATLGQAMDNYYIHMTAIVSGYSFGIMFNVLLLWATATENKWMVLPWLIYYVLVIFVILCSG
jgi:hypothetical protein